MKLTEQEASAVQHWICRRYEQIHHPKGTKRRTDADHDPRLTLTEWREIKGWTMTDLLRELRGWRDSKGRGRSLETIRAIEDGTSDWRHYPAILAIEDILGLKHGELKVRRSYEPRGIRAAA